FTFVDVIQPAALEHDKTPRSIIEDRRHSLWIGAESGLYRMNPGGVAERYAAPEGLPAYGNGRAVLEDREGRVWVGTGSGLFQLVRDPLPHRTVVERVYTTKDGLLNNNVNSLLQSADGRLWVGTGSGLSEFIPAQTQDRGSFRSYTAANGFSDSAPTSIAEDRAHNLWIGTGYGRPLRLSPPGFSRSYHSHPL